MFKKSISDIFDSKIKKLKKLKWIEEDKKYLKITKEDMYYLK